MSMKFIKAIRELQTHPGRTFLAVFALILGIWGAGSVFVSYYILTRDLNQNFQRTLPAHLILESDDFSGLNLREFRQRPEVESAEFRDFSLHRIETYPDVWVPVLLYGVENFESFEIARVFHQEGAIHPPLGSILMERDGKLISDIHTGASPRMRVGSKVVNVPVSGICFDPAQAPATQDHIIYAYTEKDSYAALTGLSVNHRLIIRLKGVSSAKEVKDRADVMIAALGKKGISMTRTSIPLFNEHPHQWQLNTLLFVIGSVGFLAFLMGAVLVSQLMQSIMAGQIRQIGIMKSLGATPFHVFQIYTFMLLIMGLTASLVAVPASVITGVQFSRFVAKILNFDILSVVPVYIYLLLVMAGLLLPLVLSFPLLIRGTKTSVLKAVRDYGISAGISGLNGKFQKITQFPWLTGSFILAVRNSARNSRRLAATIITMSLGVAIFSTGFNVRQSLWNLLTDLENELRYDVQVVLGEKITQEAAMLPFENLVNVKTVQAWSGGSGVIQSDVMATNTTAGIVALPYNTDLLKPRIINGRWLQKSDETEVVLNQQAWQLYNFPEPGADIELTVGDSSAVVRVVGIVEQFDKAKVFMDRAKYDAAFNPAHLVNTLTFAAQNDDYEQVITLKKEIEKAILTSDLDVLYVMTNAGRVRVIYAHLNIILSTILILSFLVLLVSAVGMASTTTINIGERTREIGVMRAIGATPQKIYSLFTNEGMIVSVSSIILGLILAYPLSQAASVFFGRLMLGEQAILRYAFSPWGFGITLMITLLFGWMASRLPAVSAVTKISTREALAYG
ncbi:MAG: FtsX-like permease family protein [Bacteroidia bacterium]|nr:FtsX-like permease family protein [Bacteroidia bacterium]